MNELTEIMARSFTLEELARRFLDHSDPAVREFAKKVLHDLDFAELDDEA